MGSSSEGMTHSNISIVFFDGVCNLCNGAIQFIIKHDSKAFFKFAPLQSEVAEKYLSRDRTSRLNTIILLEDGQVYEKSSAVLRIARRLDKPWAWLYVFIYLPRFFRDAVYNLISKSRYRIFGKKDQCMLPSPDIQKRFI